MGGTPKFGFEALSQVIGVTGQFCCNFGDGEFGVADLIVKEVDGL